MDAAAGTPRSGRFTYRKSVNSYPGNRGGRALVPAPAHAPHAALLIDFDNVTLGVRSDLTKELRHLLDSDIIKGKVSVQRAYADWRRYPQYIVPLSESSIDLIFAPAFGTNKKNATDIRLAIDATELVFTRPEIGTFILLSGDSDFSSLVIKLKEYGKYVIGVGIRESASDILIQNCDEYYSYSDLAGLTREVDTPSAQRDPWELVVEAVDQMVRNRDVMRADRLKQVMQQIDSNFDESNAGFNRFSKFIQEAGTRGLIKLTRLDNGQFEVAPARSAGAIPSAQREGSPSSAKREGPVPSPKGEGSPSSAKRGAKPASSAAPETPADASAEADAKPRSRRGRGRRGGAERTATADVTPSPAEPNVPVPAPSVAEEAVPLAESAASEATAQDKDRRRRRRGGRGRRGGEGSEAPAAAVQPIAASVGLTLAEAFHLLSRALGELPTPVAHDVLRARMAALHGRDDSMLEVERFPRLLRQANDAEVADVRMIDDENFEVSPHKADLAHQFRPTTSTPVNGNGTEPARPATAVRFRSGSTTSRRTGAAVPMVGVISLGVVAAPPATEKPVEIEAPPVVEAVVAESKPVAKTAKSSSVRSKKAAPAATKASTAPPATKAAKTAKVAKPAKTARSAPAKKAASAEKPKVEKTATAKAPKAPKVAAKKAAKKSTKKTAAR